MQHSADMKFSAGFLLLLILEGNVRIRMVEAVVSFSIEILDDLLIGEAKLLQGVDDNVK